jgi:hypothetical protein
MMPRHFTADKEDRSVAVMFESAASMMPRHFTADNHPPQKAACHKDLPMSLREVCTKGTGAGQPEWPMVAQDRKLSDF